MLINVELDRLMGKGFGTRCHFCHLCHQQRLIIFLIVGHQPVHFSNPGGERQDPRLVGSYQRGPARPAAIADNASKGRKVVGSVGALLVDQQVVHPSPQLLDDAVLEAAQQAGTESSINNRKNWSSQMTFYL